MLGSLIPFLRRPFEFREKCTAEHESILRIDVGPKELYLVTDPEDIEEIFITKSDSFQKPELMRERLGDAFGNGLLLSGGEIWDAQRELAQPEFEASRIGEYIDQMGTIAHGVVSNWDNKNYDMRAEMERITIPILVECLFGTENVEYVQRIAEGAEALTMKYKPTSLSFYLPDWVPTPINMRYHRGLKLLDNTVDDILTERNRGVNRDDLLSVLLKAANEDRYIDRKLIRDEMITIMTGGSGPPAFALAYTLFLLAHHPRQYEQLQAEADAVLDGANPTISDMAELTHTEHVYKESLRLYPPVWTIGRESAESVTIGGYHIPKGTSMVITSWATHRDERFFEKPKVFDPGRWDQDQNRPQFAYFPFGGGPRICIGKRFALTEAKVVLSLIASKYDIEPAHTESLDHRVSTHISPKNAEIRVQPRQD
ncbi:unspecific monooxygenase (cytochrome P450) [Natrialba aegyptia DSM 13077]|uniref:Unspecific monooxygenase (Cytochrome P450) n=1 Tax=Natrialba aegyptia DSM 13077 TaxID=1227491 RepID=M0ARU8_9EURY|nr:unspecific monooxygenase (cytochrome P450) [Natrialba aegyptia DSM 13077]